MKLLASINWKHALGSALISTTLVIPLQWIVHRASYKSGYKDGYVYCSHEQFKSNLNGKDVSFFLNPLLQR